MTDEETYNSLMGELSDTINEKSGTTGQNTLSEMVEKAKSMNGGSSSGSGDISLELLWENPNMGSEFQPQTITLPENDYNLFLIKGTEYSQTIMVKDSSNLLISYSGWHKHTLARTVTISGNNVTFGTAYIEGGNSDNNGSVPNYIYGIK